MVLVNNFEVLDMALNLERNGINFYGKAARGTPDKSLAKLLTGLVEMEREHERTFADMREHLTEAQRQVELSDKEGVASAYLDSLLHGRVIFDPAFDAQAWLQANPTPVDLLRQAVSFEKDSVLFYLGIREIVPASESTARIEQVIREEKSHIILLTGQLRLVQGLG